MPPLRELLRSLRGVFAREVLPPPPPEVRRAGRPGLARLLFAPEPLPRDPPPAARGRGLLAAIFAPERLPRDPAPAPARGGTAWLRWLFGPERLDPPGRGTEEE